MAHSVDTPPLVDQIARIMAEVAHEDRLVPLYSGYMSDAHVGLLLLLAALIVMGITFGKQLHERSREVYLTTPSVIALFVFLLGTLMVAAEAKLVGLTEYFEYSLRLVVGAAVLVTGITFASLYTIRFLVRIWDAIRGFKEALHTKLVAKYRFPETADEFANAIIYAIEFVVRKVEFLRKKKVAT